MILIMCARDPSTEPHLSHYERVLHVLFMHLQVSLAEHSKRRSRWFANPK